MPTVNPISNAQSSAATALGGASGQCELRRVAENLVGNVFYGTLLRQMRSATLKGAYGHGGRGEEVFAAQLDQVLAERAGASGGFDLVQALMKRLTPATSDGSSSGDLSQ